MNNENIKEILDRLDYNEWEVDLYKVPITWDELYDIRDYITNLEKENEMYAQLKDEYEDIIDKAINHINEHCIDDEFYINLTNKEKEIYVVKDILEGREIK